ncbi:tol-pal system protein YbgF [Desulfovulcanus sp.]
MLKPLLYTLVLSFLLVGCADKWPKSKEWRLQVLEENFLNLKNGQEKTKTRLAQLENRLSDVEENLLKIRQKEKENQILETEIQEKDAAKPEPKQDVVEPKDNNGTLVHDDGAKEMQEAKITPRAEKQEDENAEQDLYKRALDLIWQNKPEQARRLLLSFKDKYPQSKLLPNVLYWIGETYYSQAQFAKSILTFKQVVQIFPKHHKAAHALLKIAYAYEKLNDINNALFYLKVLTQDYPKSEVATRAREKIREIKDQ